MGLDKSKLQIEREDPHDGFGINGVPSGDQVKIIIEPCDCIDESFDLVDGI